MDNLFTLYLLSITDKLGGGLETLTVISGLVCAVFIIGSLFYRFGSINGWSESEEEVAGLSFWKKGIKYSTAVFLPAAILSSMVPGKRDIVEAYAMVEGSKIITAANGEKVAAEVAERFDSFLAILAKKWDVDEDKPKAEEKPATEKPAEASK